MRPDLSTPNFTYMQFILPTMQRIQTQKSIIT